MNGQLTVAKTARHLAAIGRTAGWAMAGNANWIVAAGVALVVIAPSARADDARTARLRLLCAQISGDLAEPGGIAQFRRCMTAHDPVAAMRQNAAPPRRPMPQLVHPVGPLTGSGVALTADGRDHGAAACGNGRLWRQATPGDHLCVDPSARAAAAFDNAHAGGRARGPGGACGAGYVWREATAGDRVCVTPAIRALTRSQNAGTVR